MAPPSKHTQHTTEEEAQAKKPNRKGFGARKRQGEKVRTKNNEKFHTEFKRRNNELRDSYCRFDDLDEFLASLKLSEQIGHPTVEVEVQVQPAIEAIVDVTIDYLNYQKVNVVDTDRRTLTDVLTLQTQTKVAKAREGSPFPSTANPDLVDYTAKMFSQTLKSTALFLDQIGQFEVDGQRFIPKLAMPVDDVEYPATDIWHETSVVAEIEGKRSTLYVAKDTHGVWPDLANVDELFALPTRQKRWFCGMSANVATVSTRYADLLNRIGRKLSFALVDIDYSKPMGSAAQIVGSRDSPIRARERDAWSPRVVPMSTMILGACYGFGFRSNDRWHQELSAACTTRTETSQFYQKTVALNGKDRDKAQQK